MSPLLIVLVAIGGLLVLVWVLSALSILFGLRRVNPARSQSRPGIWSGTTVGLLLLGATLLTVNVVSLLAGTAWYKLRGKPLPPDPGARR